MCGTDRAARRPPPRLPFRSPASGVGLILSGGHHRATKRSMIVRYQTYMGLMFAIAWFFFGGLVTVATLDRFHPFLFLGGYSEPPAIWSLGTLLGLTVMPILLIFGGIPAAVQMMRGRPWKMAAAIALAMCATTWTFVVIVVFWGPSLWGWTW